MFNVGETFNGCICQKDNDEEHVSSLAVLFKLSSTRIFLSVIVVDSKGAAERVKCAKR